MKPSQALMGALSLALCTLVAVPAQAQTRAALVQNIDEPGRSPYQEFGRVACEPRRCTYSFFTVPAGKRLVVTNISGMTFVSAGNYPTGELASAFGDGSVMFTAVRGADVGGGATQMFVNLQTLLYFRPGDTPRLIMQFMGTTPDTFPATGQMTLTGYYITLP